MVGEVQWDKFVIKNKKLNSSIPVGMLSMSYLTLYFAPNLGNPWGDLVRLGDASLCFPFVSSFVVLSEDLVMCIFSVL